MSDNFKPKVNTPLIVRLALLISLAFSSLLSAQPSHSYTTLAENLDRPWAGAFLPSGAFIFTELSGQIKVLQTNGEVSSNITGVPSVVHKSQGGLSDIVLSPQYSQDSTIYFSYSGKQPGKGNKYTLFIAKAVFNEKMLSLTNVETVFYADAPRSASVHYGAKLAFLPDGTLIFASGDGFDYREQAQNLSSHFGKFLRINPNGSVPADNPFISTKLAQPEVFSYGHRNPQGLTITSKGEIISHEHGPRGGDEINILSPGLNYGWPAITYGIDYSGAYISPFTSHPDMEQPIHYWIPSIAPSGLLHYEGEMFADWNDSLLVTGLVSRNVHLITNWRTNPTRVEILGELEERLRNIYQTPEGAILLMTDGPQGKLVLVEKR